MRPSATEHAGSLALVCAFGLLAACGRLGFDATADVNPNPVQDDGSVTDSGPVDSGRLDQGPGEDTGLDAGSDAGVGVDTGADVGGDAGVDAGTDLGVPDTGDAGLNPDPLTLERDTIDLWVDQGGLAEAEIRIVSGVGSVQSLNSTQPWLQASELTERWEVDVNAQGLVLGTQAVTVSNSQGLTLTVRVHVFRVRTLGLDAAACGPTPCDHVGPGALQLADQAAGADYTHFVLYGAAGDEFDAIVEPLGPRWIGPAQITSSDDFVRLRCESPDELMGTLKITHAPTRIESVEIHIGPRCRNAIRTDLPRESGGNERILLERLVMRSFVPERRGNNSIVNAVRLGDFTTLRNSFVDGHYEGGIPAEGTRGVRIEHNTFMPHDGPMFVDLTGATDALVAHNVSVSLKATFPFFVEGDAQTRATVVGNLIERYDVLINGAGQVVSRDNQLAEVPLDAPIIPQFLANAQVAGSTLAPGRGLSLDSADLVLTGSRLPGAYQDRSPRNLPRNRTIVVGDNCPNDCEVDVSETDEVQRALWLAWPDQAVELRPYDSYAGRAVVAWPVILYGTGSFDEVVLQDRAEDSELDSFGQWRGGGTLSVLVGVEGQVAIFNLTVQASRSHGVIAEGSQGASLRWLKNLAVVGQSSGAAYALESGALLADSIARGNFFGCTETGHFYFANQMLPDLSPTVVNFSCRLGNQTNAPGFFGISHSDGAQFVNVVASRDSPTGIPLFFNSNVARPAVTVRIANATIRGASTLVPAPAPAPAPQFDEANVEAVGITTGLFQSPTNLRLIPGSIAIDDGGTIPTLPLALGDAIDGTSRSGRTPDQGAYEQGN